jgi:hypothetical protein
VLLQIVEKQQVVLLLEQAALLQLAHSPNQKY